jgi:hypothetical protein
VLAGPVTNVPYWSQWLGWVADLPRHADPWRSRARLALRWYCRCWAPGRLRDRCLGDLARVTTRFASEWLWAALLTALNLLVLAHAALT